MFEVGTPVIVLASTYTKKCSPRVGSLAFVVERAGISSINNNFIETHLKLVFFKYGFEKKIRSELRYNKVIVPSYKVLSKGMSFSSKQVITHIKRTGLKKEKKVLLVAPINKYININEKIFFAFLNSLNNNTNTQTLLNNLIHAETSKEGWPQKLRATLNKTYGRELRVFIYLLNNTSSGKLDNVLKKQFYMEGKRLFLYYLKLSQTLKSLIIMGQDTEKINYSLMKLRFPEFLFKSNLDTILFNYNHRTNTQTNQNFIRPEVLHKFKQDLIVEGIKLFKQHGEIA